MDPLQQDQDVRTPVVRRVVTGQTRAGTSVFTHVEDVDRRDLGGELAWYGIWGWNETPTLPYCNTAPFVPESVLPPAELGPVRVTGFVVPPHFPGSGAHEMATRAHSTDSVDVVVVADGEICLEQADDGEVTLRRGDIVIQNGASHMWRNRSDDPCLVFHVVFGTTRSDGSTASGS